ncbi:hypothetical protein JTF12_22340 [Leclercia adecarboxylata]|jgi:hypothetical protein|uniref:Uncharacterized protein n=1 Tax=Leclercia tamurae TaxID=2926467 RepID=A0ABT2R772_9ENTR|nr:MULTISPECIES: hypothetical protein [Leclercia]MBM6637061.1 hypothetical protein [Leclercia adecarboxylata]MCU6676721.1 hypothetical protein [Leclercia tamurae]
MNKKKVTDRRELMKDRAVLREIIIAIRAMMKPGSSLPAKAMIHVLTYPFLFLRLR